MVIYYSKSGKTRIFAEELSKLLKVRLFELVEERPHEGFFGDLRGVWEAIRGKEAKVKSLPNLSGVKRVFVCGPIWAGKIAPAARYFINHADLKDVEINVLTTCKDAASRQKYADTALEELTASGAAGRVRGAAYGFVAADGKAAADRKTIKAQMEAMISRK